MSRSRWSRDLTRWSVLATAILAVSASTAWAGPREQANVASLHGWLAADRPPRDVDRLFAGFTAWSPPFREPAGRAVTAAQERTDAPPQGPSASAPEGPSDA